MFDRTDIHTHDRNRITSAVINISPEDEIIPGALHSVGIHPWNAGDVTSKMLQALDRMAYNPNVVAIGETGLDSLRGGCYESQVDILMRHISLSEATGKPLILHIVRRFQEIVDLRNATRAKSPWIVHGFRGKPQLAAQLLNHGFYISLGEHFNEQTAAMIPQERLLFESDESAMSIDEIVMRIQNVRVKLQK